ncbi:MAG: PEP-CTERM sorting domain-containing protein [Candidatus Omnitrophota bacterium]
MRTKILGLMFAMFLMVTITGCSGGGSAFSNLFGSGGGSDGTLYADGSGSTGAGGVNPEPATMALLGGGLAAFVFLKRKNRRK